MFRFNVWANVASVKLVQHWPIYLFPNIGTAMVVFRSQKNPLKTVEYTFHRSSRKKLNRGEIVLFNIPIPKTLEKGPWEVFLQGTKKPISKQKWSTKPLTYHKH